MDAGGELDRRAREDRRHISRRAIIAVLVFAGLRLGELLKLRWRDVDLAGGWLHVTDELADTKTDAGRRKVKVRGALRDVLLAVKPTDADPDALVFATSEGKQHSPSNVRKRVLEPAVQRASESLCAMASSISSSRFRFLIPAFSRRMCWSRRRLSAALAFGL